IEVAARAAAAAAGGTTDATTPTDEGASQRLAASVQAAGEEVLEQAGVTSPEDGAEALAPAAADGVPGEARSASRQSVTPASVQHEVAAPGASAVRSASDGTDARASEGQASEVELNVARVDSAEPHSGQPQADVPVNAGATAVTAPTTPSGVAEVEVRLPVRA